MTHIMSQAKKWARSMKEYLLTDKCADLVILMTDIMKPKFYICKRILNVLNFFDQVLNG